MFKHISSEILQQLKFVDPELPQQLVVTLLEVYPQQLKTINIHKSERSSLEYGRSVHALKGAIAVFGCHDICVLLKESELLAKANKLDEAILVYEKAQPLLDELLREIQNYSK